MTIQNHETCEISYDFVLKWDQRQALTYFNRKITMRWIAVASRPGGIYTADRSMEFPFQMVNDPKDIQPSYDAHQALSELVNRLAVNDWIAEPAGRYWFNRRFRREIATTGS